MRLATRIWVSAFVRNETAAGFHVAVLRKGAAEAGAVFVLQRHPGGAFSLFAPAPQAMFAKGEELDRKFELVTAVSNEAEANRYIEKQVAFDSDCWVLETDGRDPPRFLALQHDAEK